MLVTKHERLTSMLDKLLKRAEYIWNIEQELAEEREDFDNLLRESLKDEVIPS